jgi:hypothetical protein
LAQAATQFIETIIRLRLKDVEDFDESKGATYGDQMIEVLGHPIDKNLLSTINKNAY